MEVGLRGATVEEFDPVVKGVNAGARFPPLLEGDKAILERPLR